MQRLFAMALAATVLMPGGPALGDGSGSHAYRAQVAESPNAADKLYVVTTGRPVQSPRFNGRVNRSPLRPVVIDGEIVQIDEVSLRARIRDGSYAIVYPGPMVRWVISEDGSPNYPPTWY